MASLFDSESRLGRVLDRRRLGGRLGSDVQPGDERVAGEVVPEIILIFLN